MRNSQPYMPTDQLEETTPVQTEVTPPKEESAAGENVAVAVPIEETGTESPLEASAASETAAIPTEAQAAESPEEGGPAGESAAAAEPASASTLEASETVAVADPTQAESPEEGGRAGESAAAAVPTEETATASPQVVSADAPAQIQDTPAEAPEVEQAASDELAVAESDESEPGEQATSDAEPARVGYTGEIIGSVIKLEDLERRGRQEEPSLPERAELMKLIEGTLTVVSENEIVSGRVVSVGEKDVVIDIGFKSDGVVSKNEFDEDLEPGSEVQVFLERIEDYHGQLVLSKTKADKVRRWELIESVFENETVLEGTVVRRIKGGMIVELLDGLEAFLPGSQIDVRPVRDFDAYLEKRMEFKIVKINPANENVVVSHKALIEKELEVQRASILATMEAGQILEGIVKNITDFGVFIDLGGVDGLLHITDLSWGRVSHPSEVVDLDQELKVVVLDYDRERQRISLGLKQLQPHPWEDIGARLNIGDTVEGKVVSITDYGAFIELEKGIEGLVHISEMSWTDHIRHPSQKVSLGQLVNVVILNIDNEGKKISLGMKQFEQNPWEGLAGRYPPGTVLSGHVRNITTFGVFVEIEPGIDGLVHISDLSWTKKVRHPGELVKKRQELSVVILDVDEKRRRISLGHKQIETNPWTSLATVYEEGSDHTAKVLRVDSKGLLVELPLEVEAFVPAPELKDRQQSIFNAYHDGDTLDLRVLRIDVNQKEIVMSEMAKERQEARLERDREQREKRTTRAKEDRAVRQFTQREKSASGPATLGELSGLANLKAQMVASEKEPSRQVTKEEPPVAVADEAAAE